MTYIYDILLNFNNDFFEFYEWEKNDNIIHVKKIPIYKVNTVFLDDLITKKVLIDDPIKFEILNKTELFDNKKNKNIKSACLFTDSYRIVAVLLNDDGLVTKISDLLLEEAVDTIEIAKRCKLVSITYNILGTKKHYDFFTRKEIKIKKYLCKEIKTAYLEKDKTKLEYLYFEYFDRISSEIDKIYEELMYSFKLELTSRHIKLYELIKLANSKHVTNLTN